MTSDKKTLEIFNELRSGKKDYDYSTQKSIGTGGFAEVFQIKSNIDQKIYAAKVLSLPAKNLMSR